MPARRVLLSSWLLVVLALPSYAQDDDLAPLPKKAATKKPAAKPVDDDLAPLPSKPKVVKKPAAQDDDLAPLPSPKPAAPASKGRERTGKLAIKVDRGVRDAKLFIDGEEKGSLPISAPLRLKTGLHDVLVRRPGYRDFSQTVSVRENQLSQLAPALQPLPVLLSINSPVSGAEVSINGRLVGSTPFPGAKLEPGTYEVKVAKQGYSTFSGKIVLKPGVDQSVNALLNATEPRVAAAPRNPALVRPSEPTPVADRPVSAPLTPKPQAVAAAPTSVDASATQAPEASVSSGEPAWYGRWYVWAGAAVVVAGIAAGTAVAVNNSQDFTPARVCGRECDATINAPGIRSMRMGLASPPAIRF